MGHRQFASLPDRRCLETFGAWARVQRLDGPRRRSLALGLCLLMAADLAFSEPNKSSAASHDLIGTWKVTVVPPVPGVPPHIAFTSYAAGGVLIGSPILFLPPPVARMDTAHGTWRKIGANEFALTFTAFGYDAAGQPVGIVKVNATERLTGRDSLEGRSQLFICSLKLECPEPAPGYATFTATRISAEPLVGP